MKTRYDAVPSDNANRTNGSAAAAIFSAGVGCFVLAVLAILGDKSAAIRGSLVFYKPTGPLSGLTTVAILVWLITWTILDWSWRKKTLPAARISAIALVLLFLSFLLTFPPVGDLF